MNKQSSSASETEQKGASAQGAGSTDSAAQPSYPQGDAEDGALVKKASAGDGEAFEALFEKYRRRLYATVWRLVRDEDQALDIVQDAFVKAYENLDRLRGESRFFPWLRSIAVNLSLDKLRRRKRVREVSLTAGDDDEDGRIDRTAEAAMERTEEDDPGKLSEQSEFQDAFDAAVKQLSEDHRVVFLLHASEGMRYREIADTLEINVGTVMSRLFYARQKLQTLLAPHLEERNKGKGGQGEEE